MIARCRTMLCAKLMGLFTPLDWLVTLIEARQHGWLSDLLSRRGDEVVGTLVMLLSMFLLMPKTHLVLLSSLTLPAMDDGLIVHSPKCTRDNSDH
jgi:hypothetical protein